MCLEKVEFKFNQNDYSEGLKSYIKSLYDKGYGMAQN